MIASQCPTSTGKSQGAIFVQAHQGFLRAFTSVTNSTQPRNNILKAWNSMSNVPPEEVTRCGMSTFPGHLN